MTRYRVVRLLTYTYDDAETMTRDMARWKPDRFAPVPGIEIRSAVVAPEPIDEGRSS